MIESTTTEEPSMPATTIALTFCFQHRGERTLHAYIEVDPASAAGDTRELLELAARHTLGQHFGHSGDWDTVSTRIDVAHITGWYEGSEPAEPDAFYCRANGRHGWFNVATRRITQTG